MKQIAKKITLSIVVIVLAATGSYILGHYSSDIDRAVTESRCRAGAFMAHTSNPNAVTADEHKDTDSAIAHAASMDTTTTLKDVTTIGTNLIANSSVETVNGDQPTNWSHTTNGTNNAKFSLVSGYQSKTGLRIETTEYTNGNGDWFGPALKLTPGSYYQYQEYYRSNMTTRAVLAMTNADGKIQYIDLSATAPSDTWKQYTVRFFVPTNVTQVQLSHPLDGKGWLENDNFDLRQVQPEGFTRPLVSVTFDDGWKSIYDNALPILDRYGMVSTQYIVSGFVGSIDGYMKPSQVYELRKRGNEIASHTVDHPDLTKLSDKDLSYQLATSHDNLGKCFGSVTAFAAPYGATSMKSTDDIAGLYQTARTTDAGFNSADNLYAYGLKVQNVEADTTPAQLKAWIDTASRNRVWLILVYHAVDDTKGEYARKVSDFDKDMQTLKASGLTIKTVTDAYTEVSAQASKK